MDMKIVVSDDKDIVSAIRQGLKETGGYCPCRIDRTPDNKCLCKEFREQTSEGPCHCGLYVKILKK